MIEPLMLTHRFDNLRPQRDGCQQVADAMRTGGNGLAIRDLRFARVRVHFELAEHAVDQHLEVVYHLYSDRHPAWLRVRARVTRDDPHIPTITGLWEGAMFHEREMYDMMGIVFDGNRDLRRIYMSPDYRSFPQRKDFLLPDDAADSSAANGFTGVTPTRFAYASPGASSGWMPPARSATDEMVGIACRIKLSSMSILVLIGLLFLLCKYLTIMCIAQ